MLSGPSTSSTFFCVFLRSAFYFYVFRFPFYVPVLRFISERPRAPREIDEEARKRGEHAADDREQKIDPHVHALGHRRFTLAEAHGACERHARHGEHQRREYRPEPPATGHRSKSLAPGLK